MSSCQPPTVCICVHLANSREKYFFFPTNVHFLAVLKQISEQLLFLLIAIVWCFKKKKSRVLFSPKFLTCSVISYQITPWCIKNMKEGPSLLGSPRSRAFTEHPPICSPLHPFVLSATLVFLNQFYPCFFKDAALQQGIRILVGNSFQELGHCSNAPTAGWLGFTYNQGTKYKQQQKRSNRPMNTQYPQANIT